MSEHFKENAALVFQVVIAVVLGMAVILNCWTAREVIIEGKINSSQNTKLEDEDARLTRVELNGSTAIQTHVKSDDDRVAEIKTRLDKTEAVVAGLQQSMSRVESQTATMSVKLDGVKESIERIEKATAKPHTTDVIAITNSLAQKKF